MATEEIVFDPDTVESFDGAHLCRYSDGEWVDGEPIVVLKTDYDQLLELYRELRWRMDGLEK
jgi:hypothetical protein